MRHREYIGIHAVVRDRQEASEIIPRNETFADEQKIYNYLYSVN
jgi:hypothetical protein